MVHVFVNNSGRVHVGRLSTSVEAETAQIKTVVWVPKMAKTLFLLFLQWCGTQLELDYTVGHKYYS